MWWLLLVILVVLLLVLLWWWWQQRAKSSLTTGAGGSAPESGSSLPSPPATAPTRATEAAPPSATSLVEPLAEPPTSPPAAAAGYSATTGVSEFADTAESESTSVPAAPPVPTEPPAPSAPPAPSEPPAPSAPPAPAEPPAPADEAQGFVSASVPESDESADTDVDFNAASVATTPPGQGTEAAPEPAVSATSEPYGPGSAAPGADGSGPAGYTVKGNADSMLYHTDESPYYRRTKAEVWFDSESTAKAAGFTRWDQRDRSSEGDSSVQAFASAPAGAYGPGSADPAEDGSGPTGYDIKGNADSMLYHTPESPYYGRTKAEVWFDSASTAEAGGFTRWDRRDSGQADAGAAPQGFATVPDGAFGPGSADPAEDGSGPAGYDIKGNADSMLFHGQDSPFYSITKAEVWFRSEEDARNAGFRRHDE